MCYILYIWQSYLNFESQKVTTQESNEIISCSVINYMNKKFTRNNTKQVLMNYLDGSECIFFNDHA